MCKISLIKVGWHVLRVKNMHPGSPSDPSGTAAAEAKQRCVGCQVKQKTSMNMNLVLFCAKIQLELKNLQKCGKDTKIHSFFVVFHTFFKCSPILAQKTPKIIFLEVLGFF